MWGIMWGITLTEQKKGSRKSLKPLPLVAGPTRLELATSGVTGYPKCTPPNDFKMLQHAKKG
jgi:hypothetical protein